MTSENHSLGKVVVRCRHCDAPFLAWIANVRRGKSKFCSRKCDGAYKRTKEYIEYLGVSYYIHRDGYYVSTDHRKYLNRVVWEAHHGPVPPGHKVYVRDGVRSNYDIENLYLKKLKG